MSAIVLHGVGFAYPPGSWVIRGLTGEIPPGSTLAVLGPNGRGKSTLLRLLLGTLPPGEGTVRLAGRPAYVPQTFASAFDYTVIDMVVMGRARHVPMLAQPTPADEAAAYAALAELGIAGFALRRFNSLSGGERQLVILARAIVSEARILLLDEPTSALDYANQAIVLDWIRRLSRERGWTIVFTTHNPHHALVASDYTLLLAKETNPLFAPTDDALTAERLSALYGVAMVRLPVDEGANGPERQIIAPIL